MPSFCQCLRESAIEHPVKTWSTVTECIVSMILAVSGSLINWKLWKQLILERKNRPLGRKGNVIEPIMRWFCVHQVFFSPFYFLYNWMRVNGILPLDIPNFLCIVMSNIAVLGRNYANFSSLFVVTIRYIYIVHDKKANQWHFEKVGRGFQIASVIIPSFFAFGTLFTFDPFLFIDRDETVSKCPNVFNATVHDIDELDSFQLQLANQILPQMIVRPMGIVSSSVNLLAGCNIIDAILYLQIFRKMKR